MTKSIAMYYAFARSGGTLVNQLLGCSQDVVVLSEISPQKSVLPIERQLCDWHQLLSPDACAAFSRLGYQEQIDRAHTLATAAGKNLCVRDWVVIDFLPDVDADGEPSGALENLIYLQSAGYEVRHCAILRRSHDVHASIRRHIPSGKNLSPESFAEYYKHYLQELARKEVPRFFLEDIQANTETLTRRICNTLGLPPPASIADFHQYQKCTGNNSLADKPASAEQPRITRTTGYGCTENPLFAELDKLAGYEN